jgi:hypothetical protein
LETVLLILPVFLKEYNQSKQIHRAGALIERMTVANIQQKDRPWKTSPYWELALPH